MLIFRSKHCFLILLTAAFWCLQPENIACGFATQDILSPGIQALRYKRTSHFWAQFDNAGVDSTITTTPPGSVFIDRKVETLAIVGGEVAASGGQIGVRSNLKISNMIQKGEEQEEPKTPRSRNRLTAEPSLDVTFVNHKGLELFAGVQALAIIEEKSEISSSVADSDITYSPVNLFAGRAGLVKRGSTWSGGFYYNHWKDSTRSFEKNSSDGVSISGVSHVLIPSAYGIVGEFNKGDFHFEFDLGSVQAGDGGERTDDGNLVHDDYLRAYLGLFVPFSGQLGLRSAIAWQSISYSNNAYASIETISMTSLRTYLVLGNQLSSLYAGIIFGYGTGGTDITEYKARFKSQALALSLGVFFPI